MSTCEECRGTGRVGGPLEARYNDLGGFSCSIGKVGPCEKCGGSGRAGDLSKPGPMVLTGSVAFAVERDALKADNDRLRRELEEANLKVAAEKEQRQMWHESAVKYCARIDELKAELARMRPVVEAVTKWRLHMSSETIGHLIETHAIYLHGAGAGKGGES